MQIKYLVRSLVTSTFLVKLRRQWRNLRGPISQLRFVTLLCVTLAFTLAFTLALESHVKIHEWFAQTDKDEEFHICYTPEDTKEQWERMTRSMFSILASSHVNSWKRIVFHVFGQHVNLLHEYIDTELLHSEGVRLFKYTNTTGLVLEDRKVHSEYKKLLKPEVYVRFYIPHLLFIGIVKYLYLDTD